MDGETLRLGAVGALKGYLHPISVARSVMEHLPHVFLAGEGAMRYAGEIGEERAELVTEIGRERYRRWFDQVVPEGVKKRWPNVPMAAYAVKALDPVEPHGTTILLVLNVDGTMAAGVSTSGLAWKYPGRLGDSPVAGAGCYVDSRYGAAACTGMGELAIRTCASYSVVSALRLGLSVQEGCLKTAEDIASLDPPEGGVITIHALSATGDHHVVRVGPKSKSIYYLWQGRMRKFAERRVDHFEVR
jgi:L-asparaginase